MKVLAAALVTCFAVTPATAQWLTLRTPGIPRTEDGRPDLTAPAPRTADGRPDLTGFWYGSGGRGRPDTDTVLPWAQETARRRQEQFLKDRPVYRCLPSGPEAIGGSRRIVQTPALIAILNDDLTHRQIFMDGRELERDPHPTWMGYSVGHWEGDTLVVESFGFNDKTWLHMSGLPHTERLRVRERFRRRDFGNLDVEVTFTDPGAYTKPWSVTLNLQFAADTEMIEALCENSSDHWTGSWSEAQQSKVVVAPDVLASYVGVYTGLWAGMPRTVRVVPTEGGLGLITDWIDETVPLVAQSDTLFISAQGYPYEFVRDASGRTSHVVEVHVSGSYPLTRQP